MKYLLACVLLWQIHAAPMPDCMVCNEVGSTCSQDEHCCQDMICAYDALSMKSTCQEPVSCANGLMKVNNETPPKAFCCHKDCVVCGGPSCGTDVLGAANCCGGQIEKNGRKCGVVDGPPCMYPEAKYAQCATHEDRHDMNGPTTSCSTDADCCKGYACEAGECVYYEPKTNCCPGGGILDGLGRTCCDSGCGECGGPSCGTRPGGADNCCSGVIMAKEGPNLCTTDAVTPCVVESNFCATGVANPSGEYCCDSACGTCGGAGCGSRPGGDECCGSYIEAAFDYCAHSGDVTCKIPKYCMDGIINEGNTICCESQCGTCGGAGCASRPGGSAACCGAGINSVCSGFDDTACNLPWAAAP